MSSPKFELRFPVVDVEGWAVRYVGQNFQIEEVERNLQTIARLAKQRGYMTRGEFLKIAMWKSPRPRKWYEDNSYGKIKSATKAAFSTRNSRVKIERLIELSGVNYPVASAILHLACNNVPILDVNALAAFGLERRTNYDFQFWSAYCDAVKEIVRESGLSYRIVDRALWTYGKCHPVTKAKNYARLASMAAHTLPRELSGGRDRERSSRSLYGSPAPTPGITSPVKGFARTPA